MDSRSFDRLAASIGMATSRRGAIRATLGALIAGTFGMRGVDVDASRRSRLKETFGPLPEGPCTAKPVGNDCKSDNECCTKNCNGKKCRWVRPGGRCTSNRQCKSHLCQNGRCSNVNPGVASGEACTQSSGCANAEAACTSYTFGWPGEFCLLPEDALCDTNAECASGFCSLSRCQSTCTVCAEGCPHTTIASAVAAAGLADDIAIAAGSYDDSVALMGIKRLTKCGDRGTVSWTTSDPALPIVAVLGESSVMLADLELYGSVPFATESLVHLVANNGRPAIYARGCTFRDHRGSASAINLDWRTQGAFEHCVFDNLHSEGPGGAISYALHEEQDISMLDIEDCTFTNCQAGWDNQGNPTQLGGAVGLFSVYAQITNTTFEGNRAVQGGAISVSSNVTLLLEDSLLQHNEATGSNIYDPVGGAIMMAAYVLPEQMTAYVSLSGSTRVVDNIAAGGGGGIGVAYVSPFQSNSASSPRILPPVNYVLNGANSRVYRNVEGAQCVRSRDNVTWTEVVNCAL